MRVETHRMFCLLQLTSDGQHLHDSAVLARSYLQSMFPCTSPVKVQLHVEGQQ